jgi:hypothetical protein
VDEQGAVEREHHGGSLDAGLRGDHVVGGVSFPLRVGCQTRLEFGRPRRPAGRWEVAKLYLGVDLANRVFRSKAG